MHVERQSSLHFIIIMKPMQLQILENFECSYTFKMFLWNRKYTLFPGLLIRKLNDVQIQLSRPISMGPKLSNNVSEAAEWILLLEHKLLKQCSTLLMSLLQQNQTSFCKRMMLVVLCMLSIQNSLPILFLIKLGVFCQKRGETY